ncbi:MAG TPA: universal stress protein [Micromonosporaceae bacterium]
MGERRRSNQEQVMVGVDGSPGSLAAVRLGAWEAKRRHLPLLLVHGYLEPMPAASYGWAPYQPASHAVRDDARGMLTEIELRTRAEYPGLSVRSTAVAGGGASTLVELSRAANLVLVGSRGQGGFAGLMIGSVGAQVATHAHAPVIVVRDGGDGPGEILADRPVLIGVDGSPASAAAIDFAFDEAAARGVPLLAVTTWWVAPVTGAVPIPSLSDQNGVEQANADRMLTEALAAWSQKYPDVPVRRLVRNDVSPEWTLIEASRDASLAVVGSRGRGGFARLVLGSTSRALVGHAHCPVAVIRDRA